MRVQLRRFRESDAEALYAYRSLPETQRYQGWEPRDVEDAREFIRRHGNVEPDTPGEWLQLAVALPDGALIGDCGLHFLADDPAQAEIGITLAPEHQGRGYATEALQLILGRLFDQLGKHRVRASVDPRNEPSRRLLERVGFRREAHFRRSVRFKGEWADDVIYAMLRSEWAARGGAGPGSSG